MPIELSQLKANTRSVIVAYYDDTVQVTYRPSELTPTREADVRAGSNDGDNGPMLSLLADMLLSWDVMSGKEPLPHTVEVLATLPSALLTAIFNEIREDMAPKTRSARSSFGR